MEAIQTFWVLNLWRCHIITSELLSQLKKSTLGKKVWSKKLNRASHSEMLKYVKTTCSNTWKMSYFDLGLLIGGYIYILIFSCFDICTLIFSCFDICILISSHHDSPTPIWYHHVANSRLWINVTRLKYLPRPFSNICLHSDRSRNVLFTMQTNTNVFFHNTNKQNVLFTIQTNRMYFSQCKQTIKDKFKREKWQFASFFPVGSIKHKCIVS